MEQREAIIKAKQFAKTAYTAASEHIHRERLNDIVGMQNKLAARGMVLSGAMVSETARITGEKIRALTEARLNAILEGYDLYGVVIDDHLAGSICGEVMSGVDQMVASFKANPFPPGMPPTAVAAYPQALAQQVGVSAAWVKTQIDRRRLMPKKAEGPTITTIYTTCRVTTHVGT